MPVVYKRRLKQRSPQRGAEMQTRSFYPRMAAALLALLGLLDAAYLTLNHYQPALGLVCPIGGGCETVQTSRWSTLPPGGGIPVALVGVIGYALLLFLAVMSLQRERLGGLSLPSLLLLVASGGLLGSLYFVALQLWVIRAICFWCMASALLEMGIWVAAYVDWRWAGAQVGGRGLFVRRLNT